MKLVFVLVILNVFDLLWLSNTSCWISQVDIFVETFRFVAWWVVEMALSTAHICFHCSVFFIAG